MRAGQFGLPAWPATLGLLAGALLAGMGSPALAQFGSAFGGSAVGGVSIDAQGAVSAPVVAETAQLQQAWQAGLQPVPGELDRLVDLRFVSLKALDAEVGRASAAGEAPADAVRFLAGLQRVRYVLVYPERQDIVLAGPAEGWKVDALGNVVGRTTNRPVLMLDDLVVALRANREAGGPVFSCSIDPTREGRQRVQRMQFFQGQSPNLAAQQLEQALGAQVVTVSGAPVTSHFARVMVAADFRMKRLAMNFERAPVEGMPSFLEMLPPRGVAQNMLPRWWLAAEFQPVRKDAQGNAWEVPGATVRCMTEDDFVNATGDRAHTGRANPVAQKWADRLTERFDELAAYDSAFAQLRNVMELAVAGAVIGKEGLAERAGLKAPALMEGYQPEQFAAPRTVATQASFVRKRDAWVISASGGVQFTPWITADRTAEDAALAAVRDRSVAAADAWWWE